MIAKVPTYKPAVFLLGYVLAFIFSFGTLLKILYDEYMSNPRTEFIEFSAWLTASSISIFFYWCGIHFLIKTIIFLIEYRYKKVQFKEVKDV